MEAIRVTIWLALAFYFLACLRMLICRAPGQGRLFWSLGWLAYVLHVAAAFHYFHGWSHEHAVEHTRQTSGFGPGIYVSHFFTLLWTLDVAQWWLWPARRERRPWWVSGLLHGFMAFIIFNGSVVFATGPSRWGGLLLFVIVGLALLKKVALASPNAQG